VKTTSALPTLHKPADSCHLQIATNLVDKRNQILSTSLSPGETTSKLPLVCQYQDWTPKE
jgi:hypothetical protein